MKQIVGILLFTLVGFSLSAKQHKNKKKKKATHEIRAMSMHRTACYGKCPVYIIELKKNGDVTYNAMMFNEDTGTFHKNIGVKKTKEIFALALKNRIDTCAAEYRVMATDLPGLIIDVEYSDTKKSIHNANYGPSVLREVYQSLDAIVGGKVDDSWHK